MSRFSSFITPWLIAAPAFAFSVLFNAALFSLLGFALFAVLFVEMGEGWEGLGLMWFGSLICMSILAVASVVALPIVREAYSTLSALLRFGTTVLLVAASRTAFAWLSGPIFPWS